MKEYQQMNHSIPNRVEWIETYTALVEWNGLLGRHES